MPPSSPRRRLAALGAGAGIFLTWFAAAPPLAAPQPPLPGAGVPNAALFDNANLLAWCIVPYDSVNRGPAARIAMLERLGFTQYVWDWRERHLPGWAEEIRLARESGMRLRGVWIWIDAEVDRVGQLGRGNRTIFDAVNAAKYPLEFWVGFHDNVFEAIDDAARVQRGAEWVGYLREQADVSGSTVALYNHGGWFGEPDNQLRIIAAAGSRGLGIVYNFHHAYGQTERFAALLPRMLPYLRAVNLSGLEPGRRDILPIGRGTREQAMIRTLAASGYTGPVGIIGHTEGEDVEVALRRNLGGLRRIVRSW